MLPFIIGRAEILQMYSTLNRDVIYFAVILQYICCTMGQLTIVNIFMSVQNECNREYFQIVQIMFMNTNVAIK